MGNEVRLVSHVKEVTKSIEDTAAKRMGEATQIVRSQVLETLSGNRSGRTYKVPGTQRTYTASAPGEPPAQATAELRKSVRASVRGEDKMVIGEVGTDRNYGPMLEFGTKNMAPRPWLRISFEKSLGKIKAALSRRWL